MEQFTIPADWLHVPRLLTAEIKLALAGKVSVSRTLRATFDPWLVTAIE
jgi:hypothetical protein